MKRFVIAYLIWALLSAGALAQGVPYFPQTLPGQTVVGRLSSQPGATEAIPFSLLSQSLKLSLGIPYPAVVGFLPKFASTSGTFASTSKLFEAADGKVGIGTTTPGDFLHVSGGGILLDNTQALDFKNASGTAYHAIRVDGSNNLQLGSTSFAGNITMATNGATPFTLTSTALTMVGTVSGSSFIPTGSTVPALGIYTPSANTLNIAVNTTALASFSTTGLVVTGNVSGSALIPTSTTVPALGFYTSAANTINVSVSTASLASFTTAGLTVSGNVSGSALIPTSSTIPTNGIYLPSSNTVNVAINSASLASFTSSGLSTTGGLKSSSATQGIGYSTGAGGTVTQGTSKSTAVVLNTMSGKITMHNASLSASTTVSFQLQNSNIAMTDHVILTRGGDLGNGQDYRIQGRLSSAGVFVVIVTNQSGGALSEAVEINFTIIKGVNS